MFNFGGLSVFSQRNMHLKTYKTTLPVRTTDFGGYFTDITSAKNKILYKKMIQLNTIESLLALDVFFDKLNESEKTELHNEVGEKYKIKLQEPIIYSQMTTVFHSIAVTYDGYLFGTYGYFNATVKTPKNSTVAVYNVQQDFTATEKSAYKSQYAQAYPSAIFLRDATTTYNCHSYAWYSTSGLYWMNDPSKYMSDGSYTSSDAIVGAKVIYKTTGGQLTHSGIVITRYSGPTQLNYNYVDLIDVNSKWGAIGLYQHRGTNCPYWSGAGGVNSNRVYYYK